MNDVPLIYIDTTVFTGCHDAQYQNWSSSLVEDCCSGLFRPITSELVQAEMSEVPDDVAASYAKFLTCNPRIEKVTEKADTLAELYIEKHILTKNLYCDALHLAIATLADADAFITLDHLHFLHFAQGRRFLKVNLELGLKPIRIYCPKHLVSHDVACS